MASTSSSTSPPPPPPENIPNWLDLPPEVTAAILHRLGPINIMQTTRNVCATWRNICDDPSMWKSIDIRNYDNGYEPSFYESAIDDPFSYDCYELERICRRAVDQSSGGLENINLEYFCNEHLLHYIALRAPQLKSLRVAMCYGITDEGLAEVAKKLPKLEELHMYFITISTDALETFGRFCPQLKSLTYNIRGSLAPYMEDVGDKEAIAIAQNMPGLRHLSLFGNQMTNKGLQAILDGCKNLESLDLRQCFNVDLSGDMESTCAQRIKILKKPNDSTEGYEFDATVNDGYGDSSYGDEYPSAFSEIDFLSDVDDDYEFSGGDDSGMSDGYDGLFFDY